MTFFFGEHLRLCPWSVASSIPVLGLGFGFFFVSSASSLVSSTPLLVTMTLSKERQNQVYH